MPISSAHNHQSIFQSILALLLTVAIPSATFAATPGFEARDNHSPASESLPHADSDQLQPSLFTVVSPTPDDHLISAKVAMTLNITRQAYRRSLGVTINGKDISALFKPSGSCNNDGCTETAPLSLRAGLTPGKNLVNIRINNRDPRLGPQLQTLYFDWTPSSPNVGLDDSAIALSPALAFKTYSTGGQYGSNPWFQIYSNALNGGTISYPSQAPCTGIYQIVTLNRQTLEQDSYACYTDDAAFTAALSSLAPADPTTAPIDLVVAGTTWYNNAGSSLNTTAIGGTDYSKYAAADQPMGYMIIGLPGAAAGSAYENYYVSSDDNGAGAFNPRINGVLSVDHTGNYNFFGYDAVPYSVDATKDVITINGNTYTPPTSVQNGIWLLQVDRWNLNPMPGCTASGNTFANCGQVFDTGDASPATASDAMTQLENALTSARHKNLLFLTTIGSNPFGALPDGTFAATIEGLGVPANTWNLFATTNVTDAKLTLVSTTDPNVSKAMIGGNAVVASSSYFHQGQTGSVYGALARDPHSFYRPIATNQGSASPTGGLASFFSMYQIPWTQPGPWDSLNGSNLQAAYRYLSYTLIQGATNKNRKSDDIHSLYVSSLNGLLVNNNSVPDATKVAMPATLPWNDPVDGQNYTFTSTDLSTEAGLLQNELGNLLQGVNFVNAVTPYITGNSSNYVTTILTAASEAANELEQPDSSSVSLNMANISNLAGALFSLAALGLDDEDMPVLAVASGVLWAAGSSQVVNPSPSGIPNPWLNITTEVSNLTAQTPTIVNNTGFAWATVQDNVFSDQAKLNAFAYNADNGWASTNEQSYKNITPAIQNSAQLSFYTQIFGSINEIDFYGAYRYASTTNPSQIYTWGIPGCYEGQCMYTCVDVYPSNLSEEGWDLYPSIGAAPNLNDFYIIGGPIKNNGSDSVSEKFPTQTQLDALFGTAAGQFNLPADMFYSSNGPLQRRTGTENPNRGWDFCSPINSTTFYPKRRS